MGTRRDPRSRLIRQCQPACLPMLCRDTDRTSAGGAGRDDRCYGKRHGCAAQFWFLQQSEETHMATNRTYVKTEVVGSSDKSVSDAIESAIATASRSLRNLEWFEVAEVRGNIRDNKVSNYQVTLKLGLRYEPKA